MALAEAGLTARAELVAVDSVGTERAHRQCRGEERGSHLVSRWGGGRREGCLRGEGLPGERSPPAGGAFWHLARSIHEMQKTM